MNLCKMSVGSSNGIDAIRCRVFEIVAENEDIDALLKECMPERANDVYSADCLSFAADGILTAIENQCVLSGCSPSVLSASIFGDRLKKLVSSIDQQQLLLDDKQRSHFLVLVETCKCLMERNVFNRKLFAKSVNKDTVLPLEVVWRLEKESLMSLDLFITSNLSRPSVIGGLAQNVVSLCSAKDGETEEMRRLRIEIISDLLVSLLTLTYGTDSPDDVTSRGVRKVSSALLDSITKKLLQQQEGARRDINIFEKLLNRYPAIDGQVMKKYGARQLMVILSSSAVFKVSDALSQQTSWTFHAMDKFLRSLYEQLLTIFDVSEVMELMQRLLEQNEVNWRSLLSFVSVLLVCETTAKALFSGFVESLLKEAMNSLNLDKIITALLLGRHGCLEGPRVFMSYQDWFQKMFGDANSSLCNSRKSFSFLMKFLTDIVPHEPAAYLQDHLRKPPSIPTKCRPLWSDYATIAKTRLLDLKATTDEVSLLGEGSESVDRDRTSQIEIDIEKAMSTFEKNLKLPESIVVASIFKKSYFTGMFLPVLLQPRPLPSAPDTKMKFIEALNKAGRIPDAQFAEYKEKCRKLTEQLLEGMFDDGDGDDEMMSLEEQLQRSLTGFRDAVLQGHLEMGKDVDRQIAAVSEILFAVTKQDATLICVTKGHEVIVNLEEGNLSHQNVQIARMVLDVICQISSARPSSGSSWLNSFLLMLFRHPALLQSMCVVIFHLLTNQGTRLASCHIPGLASMLVHWMMLDSFSKLLVVESKAGNRMSFVSHVLGSLSAVSDKSMQFLLEFAVEFFYCSDRILRREKENPTVENMEVEEEIFCQTGNAADDDRVEMSVVPKQILHIVDYVGPRMFHQLRVLSGYREVKNSQSQRQQNNSGMDPLLKSLLNIVSMETTRLSLQQNEMTFREWVEQEICIIDDAMTPGDRTSYYDWVVFVRRYRHPQNEKSPELGDYVEMCCATLVDVMIDFETQKKGKRSEHGRHEAEMMKKESEMSRSIFQTNLFHLLQKLVLYLDRLPRTSKKNPLWLWKVVEARWKGLEKSDDPGAKTRQESEACTFCEMLLLLSPSVLLSDTSTHLLNDETIRSPINYLLWFVNDAARNYTNGGLSLHPSLTCHLLEATVSLPPSCNNEIARFLSECPLFVSSVILNWSAVGHLRQMTISGTTLSSALEEIERLMQNAGGKKTEYETADIESWTEGLTAFAQIRAGRDPTVLTLVLSEEAQAVVHECFIIEAAVEILHGSKSQPEDLLRLYKTNPDLQCFISKLVKTKFDLCTSSAVQQILPFVRVYLFVVAKERNLLSGFSNSPLNLEFIVTNYNETVKLYDSFSGEQWSLFDRSIVEILGATSARILSIINATSAEQLRAVDCELFTNLDLQLKLAYNKRLLEK